MENFKRTEEIAEEQLNFMPSSIEKIILTENVSSSQRTNFPDESTSEEDKRIQFSDEELQEFKQLIVEKLDTANADFELFKNTLSLKDDNGTNDTSPTFKQLEDAVDVLSKEETAQHAMRQEKFISHLNNALIRIENKSYGVCRITGKLIAKERLRSVPHATTSIDAKRNFSG